MFPKTYSEAGFSDPASTPMRTTAAKGTTPSYSFDADVPRDQAFELVANCASGRISVAFGSVNTGGHCRHGLGGVAASAPGIT